MKYKLEGRLKSVYCVGKCGVKFDERIFWRVLEIIGDQVGDGERLIVFVDVYSFGLICYEIFIVKLLYGDIMFGLLFEKVILGERLELLLYCFDYLVECI